MCTEMQIRADKTSINFICFQACYSTYKCFNRHWTGQVGLLDGYKFVL